MSEPYMQLIKRVGGVSIVLAELPLAFYEQERTYRIEVIALGPDLAVKRDGQTVLQAVDSDLTQGTIAFSATSQAGVHYDDLVVGTNLVPLARNDDVATAEDTAVTIQPLANDSDPNGDSLKVSSIGNPSNGRARLSANSAVISYVPNADFFGQDSFTYEISDGFGGTASATVTVTVAAVNDAPIARADSARTAGGTPVTIDVLRNDTDAEHDRLGVAAVGIPAHGAAVIAPDGRITYTPSSGFYGADSCAYLVSDGNGGSTSTAVSVAVYALPGTPSIHVADLDGSVQDGQWGWQAVVTIAVADQGGNPVPGATVTGHWTSVRGPKQCITGAAGTCTLTSNDASPWAAQVALDIQAASRAGYTFDPRASSDPDGDSDGRRILIPRP
jgi:hypothetical protein